MVIFSFFVGGHPVQKVYCVLPPKYRNLTETNLQSVQNATTKAGESEATFGQSIWHVGRIDHIGPAGGIEVMYSSSGRGLNQKRKFPHPLPGRKTAKSNGIQLQKVSGTVP
ncbi:unnamed protein product [Nesidiocoris tenuis]|uniref:Uncharacterized protein n=1 Tax=Nesidiocoris tenuis TaxID=355587 RepID=A0A6H5HGY9_9HEMI|nr:unnamed protein product [Nesidiocoris tenuis]